MSYRNTASSRTSCQEGEVSVARTEGSVNTSVQGGGQRKGEVGDKHILETTAETSWKMKRVTLKAVWLLSVAKCQMCPSWI